MDRVVLSVTPNVVVEWGFNLFLADTGRDGSEIRASAKKAVRDLETALSTVRPDSPSGIYITVVRMAASGFARGIERRKRDLMERKEAVRQAKDERVERLGRNQRFGGLLRGGVHLLLVGGFAYAVVRGTFQLPRLREHYGGLSEEYVSLASALGAGLIGSFFRDWWIQRELVRLFRNFEAAIERANREYVDSVVAEYQLAAETAANAWHQLTGEPPPVTPAFKNLVIGVMRGTDTSEVAIPGHDPSPGF